MMWWFPFDGAWWVAMVVVMVLFWGGLIFLIVWGIKRLTERGAPSRRDYLDIIKERYARGELSREEYERLKKDLGA